MSNRKLRPEHTVGDHFMDVTRRRRGISELTASVAMIAVTLVAAAAVWGWVNGQIGNASVAYGTKLDANVNYLNEQETVPFSYFPSSNSITTFVDNTGAMVLTGYTISIVGPTVSILCTQGGSCCVLSGSSCGTTITNTLFVLPRSQLSSFVLTLPGIQTFASGSYSIRFIGKWGSSSSLSMSKP